MVCKVISGKSIKGALNYNENKVPKGLAECIGAVNFIAETEQLNFYNKLSRFENLIEKNTRAKTNAVHISLNFDIGEKLSQNKLNEIATTYMNKIGFGDQPYLVYEHRDAAHPHLHIVTTNIQEDGKRITIHNLGKTQSEIARREIEETYGLVRAGSKPTPSIDRRLHKAVYGKSETKRTIDNIVGEVMKRYNFSSLAEFNAVLRQYNIMADRGTEGMTMFNKNGLIYTMLDSKGNKIGIPIKASLLYSKPTLKNLDTHFQHGAIAKRPEKERLCKIIDSFFHASDKHTRANFCAYMKLYEINVMFREGRDGIVYGLTLVDNRKCNVFNGRDLGKGYSGQALIKRIGGTRNVLRAGEKESHEIASTNYYEVPQRQFQDLSLPSWVHDIAKELLNVTKAERLYEESLNPALKNENKKKNRKRIKL